MAIRVIGSYLYVGNYRAEELALRFGTPLYVYDLDTVAENYSKLVKSVPYEDFEVFYSCKANSNPWILKTLKDLGSGLDAVSPFEALLGVKLGFPRERILFTGSSVSDEEMRFVKEELGVLINVDSISQLRRYGRLFPGTEVSGVQMHRTVGVDPWTDSNLKVKALGPLRGARVLDVCTGLGYTAIAEVLSGATSVVTVEVDPNVIALAQYNPWSRGLEDSRIELVLADAVELLGELEGGSFDAVLHDPPRISIAGELYGLEFYRELYRVLRPGGRLFHYVGEPGKHSNVSYVKGVKRRLELAGFVGVTWVDSAKGFKALKPR